MKKPSSVAYKWSRRQLGIPGVRKKERTVVRVKKERSREGTSFRRGRKPFFFSEWFKEKEAAAEREGKVSRSKRKNVKATLKVKQGIHPLRWVEPGKKKEARPWIESRESIFGKFVNGKGGGHPT